MTPYCRDLLPLLKTSMDIQCVLGSYGAVVYTTDYMTKISKMMSNLLRECKTVPGKQFDLKRTTTRI